jgi:hypothetical protein
MNGLIQPAFERASHTERWEHYYNALPAVHTAFRHGMTLLGPDTNLTREEQNQVLADLLKLVWTMADAIQQMGSLNGVDVQAAVAPWLAAVQSKRHPTCPDVKPDVAK